MGNVEYTGTTPVDPVVALIIFVIFLLWYIAARTERPS